MKLALLYSLLGLLFCCASCQIINSKINTSPKTVIDSRDGQKYNYIQIRDKYWMTENLRYNIEGSIWNLNNPDTTFGRLYNWEQAIKACPDGWVLSSSGDWGVVESMVTSDSLHKDLYKKDQYRGNNEHLLKSKLYWENSGTDSLGLNIVPAGRAHKSGEFWGLGKLAFFWTATPRTERGIGVVKDFAVFRYLHHTKTGIYSGTHWKEDNYYSCRCVRYPEEKIDKAITKKVYTFKDPRDGQSYQYIKIKNYYWMIENMRYETKLSMWNPANPDTTYGRLYIQSDAALLACPKGWYSATTNAWFELESATIDLYRGEIIFKNQFRGKNVKSLKSTQGWEKPGTNEFNLNILPAGKGDFIEGTFSSLGTGAYFWIFNSYDYSFNYRYIDDKHSGIYNSKAVADDEMEETMMSCRCVRPVKDQTKSKNKKHKKQKK